MNVLYAGFAAFLESTLAASVVILVVLVLRRVFRQTLAPRIRHWLWLLVIIRLLLPVFPESPVSIFKVVDYGRYVKETLLPSAEQMGQHQTMGESQLSLPLPEEGVLNQPSAASQEQQGIYQGTGKDENAASKQFSMLMKVMAIVWSSGTLILLIHLVVFARRMDRRRQQLIQVTEPHILNLLDEVREVFKISRPLPLYTGTSLASPYISGLLKPWIFISQSLLREMDSAQLSHILAHELAHYKRKDMLWNLLGSIAAAIHWLNPLIWFSMKAIKADRELACDAYVLETMGEEEAPAYGMTMVAFMKRYSATGRPPTLLYYSNSRRRQELVRRISMISSFKKGSYKISMTALLFIVILGAVTLTNASGSAVPVGINDPKIVSNDILPAHGSRQYNRLDRAVKKAGFAFEAPAVLPMGYGLKMAHLSAAGANKGTDLMNSATLTFEAGSGKYRTGQIILEALKQVPSEGIYTLEDMAEKLKQRINVIRENKAQIQEQQIVIGDLNILQIHATEDNRLKDIYYLWERNEIGYKLDLGGASLTEEQSESLIASMKLPDERMKNTYVNKDLLIVDILDVEDLELAASSIGFTPKFPLKVLNYELERANETSKINFSYPENEQDELSRVLYNRYVDETSSDNEHSARFTFAQIKDNGLYAKMRNNGQALFERIDRGQVQVPVTPVIVGGQEVLQTAPYKVDGELSAPHEPDFISYFWLEQGVCYQAVFSNAQVQNEQDIVAALIRSRPVDLEELR
ncbi:M56 family metallopeptidase [Paenibacillus agri]|uniref:M56 family metallopeptidase n=1 Tax=Paenibacillus agri TaxID=2744309 RepID=A0A850EJ84_9BACL|nr:M56 family metallopeptidase [Paenibacillus agri]NUU60978.1 M56 family metallopeptidase [Paenibacillus agri]